MAREGTIIQVRVGNFLHLPTLQYLTLQVLITNPKKHKLAAGVLIYVSQLPPRN